MVLFLFKICWLICQFLYLVTFVAAYNTYAVQGVDVSFPRLHFQSYDGRVRRDTSAAAAAVAAPASASPTAPVPATLAAASNPPNSSDEPNRTVNASKYNSSNDLGCQRLSTMNPGHCA